MDQDQKRIESSYRGQKYTIIEHDFEGSWCLFIGENRRGYFDTLKDAHLWARKLIDETPLDRLWMRIRRTWKAAQSEWKRG